MASARDVSDVVGLPTGLTPTAEGKVKRLLVVGESRDAKSTIINFLCNPEAAQQQRASSHTDRRQPPPRATMEITECVSTSIPSPPHSARCYRRWPWRKKRASKPHVRRIDAALPDDERLREVLSAATREVLSAVHSRASVSEVAMRVQVLNACLGEMQLPASRSQPAAVPRLASSPSLHGMEKHEVRAPSTGAASAPAERYCPDRSPIRAFLIDLDGTMYEPAGLLPGAAAFYAWLVASRTPHIFLSNTGAKNSSGVQRKFRSPPFSLSGPEVPLSHILTAAETQVDYLLKEVPRNARLYVLSGGSGTWRSDLLTRGGAEGAALVGTWDVRTTLSAGEAKAWAAHQALCRHEASKAVWVVFFHDGEVGGPGCDTREWSFEVIKIAGFLLSHGAQLVYTADDAFNPSVDPEHPGLVFPLPGPGSSKQLYMNERHPLTTSRMAKHRPGMFAAMMRTLMYPAGSESVACAGKGGNKGGEMMMERARQMLIAQGHDGDPSTICMVGDRFDTDIRAGRSAGVRTCLALSGCHNLESQRHYPSDVADFFVAGVGDLVPEGARRASLREQSSWVGASKSRLGSQPAEELVEWTLIQSDLTRSGRGDAARAELQSVLRRCFDAIDVNGDGTVDETELVSGFEQVGLGRLALAAARSRASDYGGRLSFDQFANVVEQSLCECGVGDSHGTEAVAVDPDARATPRLGVGLAGSSGDQGEAERSQHLDHADMCTPSPR